MEEGHLDYRNSIQTGVTDQKERIYINRGEEDELELVCYRVNRVKRVFVWIGVILSLFSLKLIFFWRKDWEVKCIGTKSSVTEADWVLIKDKYKQCFAHRVHIQVAKETTSNGYAGDNSGIVNDAYDASNDVTNIDVTFNTTEREGSSIQRFFRHQKIKYILVSEKKQFEKTSSFPSIRCSYFHNTRGLTSAEQQIRRWTFGENAVRVHVTPVLVLLVTQGLNPFYVFQVFSILLWMCAEEYYYYAACILFLTIVSLTAQIIQQRMMEHALKKTISFTRNCRVWNCDINDWKDVPSETLVPGDIIQISDVNIVPCDVVLLSGSCVMNESMLTGESVPVTKVPVSADNSIFDINEHSRHVLFSGTSVIQMRAAEDKSPPKAFVYRTGYNTAKGELVRSILFPKPLDFKFTRDSYKYVGFLAAMALVGMVYTIVVKVLNGDDTEDVIIRTLDLVTIIVPPALPAAMTFGVVFAQFRLRRSRIFCISPNTINVCGGIDVFCFDKTGTLTEEGLDVQSIRQSINASFDRGEISNFEERHHLTPEVLAAMATCHSLAIVNNELCGDPLDLKMFQFTDWALEEVDAAAGGHRFGASTIVHRKTTIPNGDRRLSTKQGLRSSISQSPTTTSDDDIGIIKQFTFSSRLQRMSVITRQRQSPGGAHQFRVFAKGSPEMVASLSVKETLPSDFDDVLNSYTREGFRVIAMATRVLHDDVADDRIDDVLAKIHKITREEVEQDFVFLGLLVLENRLKLETTPVITQLHEANIRIVMVTGDNILTALSVARGCRLLEDDEKVVMVSVSATDTERPSQVFWCPIEQPQSEKETLQRKEFERLDMDELDKEKWSSEPRISLAITGRSWALLRQHHPQFLPRVVLRGTVFARFSPDQKKQLIEELQKLGYFVGMCGDGANDCGALKAAHAGVSLSEAEASVASPFTSKEPNISCVPSLIREGRASLVTSFGIFKYMAGYSMTQFLIVCIITWPVIGSTLSDFEFLYEDLVMMTPLCFTLCFTGPHKTIATEKPMVSLVAMAPIVSLLCAMSLNLGVMLFSYYYTQAQPWYEAPDARDRFYIYRVPESDGENLNHDTTVLFLITCSHFIVMAVTFSKGYPHRANIFTNYVFMINVFLSTACTTIMIFNRWNWWADLLEMRMPPSTAFQAIIFGVSCIHFFASYLVETYFVDGLVERWLQPCLSRLVFGETVPHRLLEKELEASEDWPPVNDKSFAEVIEMELGTMITPPPPPQEQRADEETTDRQLTDGEEVSIGNGFVNRAFDSPSDCDVVVLADDIERQTSEQPLLEDDVENDVISRTHM